ncbi:MAG: hypothetical protein ACYTAN_17240, partial [Planctomycetota bacterium]
DLVARKIAIAGGVEPIPAITAAQRAREGRKIVEETEIGPEALFRQRLRDIVDEELARSQAGFFRRMLTDATMFMRERESIDYAAKLTAGWAEESRPEFTAAIRDLQQEIRDWREDLRNREHTPVTVTPYPDR